MRYSQIIEASRLPRGFRIYRMPAKTTVYHGTSASFSPYDIESPCWVSTSKAVAKWFVAYDSGNEKRIIEYITTRTLRLLYVESRNTFKDIEDRFGFDMSNDPRSMAQSVCQLGYDGWYIEDNYIEGDDTLLCDASVLKFKCIHEVSE